MMYEIRTTAKRSLIRYILVMLPLIISVVPHLDFTPLWDSAIYVGCVRDGIVNGLNLWALNCSHHPSVATFLPLAYAFKWSGGAMWSIHAMNLLLGMIAMCLMLKIFDLLYPETSRSERCLAAACIGAMPVLPASVIHTNSDYGTFIFAVVLMLSLLKRWRWLAGLASAILPLTKDPGLPVWGILVGSYLLTAVFRREGSVRHKLKAAFFFWPVSSALVSYGWYVFERHSRGLDVLAPPSTSSSWALISQALTISLFDPVWLSYLSSMFVINFLWIPSCIILIGAGLWGLKKVFGCPPESNPMRRELIVLLIILLLLLFTRFKTFVNVRYFLPIFPVIMLATFHALQSFVPWRRARIFALSLILVLFQLSAFRTFDPVSKGVYGSFKFGNHELLDMTSITKECCGRGRDQLVYNLEFTYFDSLTNQVLADLRPTAGLPLVIAHQSSWHYLQWITGSTSPQRAAVQSGTTIRAPVITAAHLTGKTQDSLPEKIIWLDLPNINGDLEFKSLLNQYKVVEEKVYSRQGYELYAKILVRL